jgi:hypothetical protein
MYKSALVRLSVVIAAFAAASPAAKAEILGFGDFSQFTVNGPSQDQGVAPVVNIAPSPVDSSIELVTGGHEDRSIFYDTPQDISHGFTASFTFQMFGADGRDGTGSAFVIQDAAAGANSLGQGAYAYSGLTPSAAIVLDIADKTGYFTDGNIGAGLTSTGSVDFRSGDLIDVMLVYNGSTLSETLLDSVTSATFSKTYLVTPALATVLGSSSAYIGFTSQVGAAFGTDGQQFSEFRFVPEPSAGVLAALAAAMLLLRLRSRACVT